MSPFFSVVHSFNLWCATLCEQLTLKDTVFIVIEDNSFYFLPIVSRPESLCILLFIHLKFTGYSSVLKKNGSKLLWHTFLTSFPCFIVLKETKNVCSHWITVFTFCGGSWTSFGYLGSWDGVMFHCREEKTNKKKPRASCISRRFFYLEKPLCRTLPSFRWAKLCRQSKCLFIVFCSPKAFPFMLNLVQQCSNDSNDLWMKKTTKRIDALLKTTKIVSNISANRNWPSKWQHNPGWHFLMPCFCYFGLFERSRSSNANSFRRLGSWLV